MARRWGRTAVDVLLSDCQYRKGTVLYGQCGVWNIGLGLIKYTYIIYIYLYIIYIYLDKKEIYIYIFVCVCVFVCLFVVVFLLVQSGPLAVYQCSGEWICFVISHTSGTAQCSL